MQHPDDDDSSAITIWGKQDLRTLLQEAQQKLDAHYGNVEAGTHSELRNLQNRLLWALLEKDSVDLHLKLTQDLHLILTHPGRQIMA